MGTCYSHLSPDERIRIERLHCEQGLSVRETARLIGRDKATVSRELKRGLWFASNENESYRPYRPRRLKTGPWTSMPFYSALAAQRRADLRRHESRKPRRMDSDRLRSWVMDELRHGWSPKLIEGRLKLEYPGDPVMRVSHECLHQWIYAKPQRDLDLRQLVDAGLADMPTPVAEDMGLASTGVDMEVAAGLMAIMAVVGAGCILVRRRID